MSTETTRSVLQRYHDELWLAHNTSVLPELVDDEFEDDSPAERTKPGPEYAKDFFEALFTAFPDLSSRNEALIAEGDIAAIRWTLTGTMQGPLWGMPASGKRFEVEGMDMIQVKNGKIVRDWGGMADALPKIFKQIGAEE